MKIRYPYLLISVVFFGVQALFSLWFAEERIVFMDNAFQTFLLVNDKGLEVMAHRYPATVVRLLPLLLAKLNFSLDAIILGFSVSYLLVQFLIVVLAHFLLRDQKWLMAITLSIALVTGHSFFWCNSELAISIPLSLLILGWTLKLEREGKFVRTIFMTIAGSILLVFYHPQSLLCYLFGLVYMMPLKWKWSKSYFLPFLPLLILLLKSTFIQNWYDTAKFGDLKSGLENYYPNYFQTESFQAFFSWMPNQLLLITLVCIAIIFTLMRARKWKKVFLLIVGSLGNLILFHVSNGSAMPIYYAEAGYLVWSGMIAVAFTFDLISLSKFKKYIYSFILLACITKILIVSGTYVKRLDAVREIVGQFEGEKVIISEKNLNPEYFQLKWALPFETLIVSTLANEVQTTTVVTVSSPTEYENFRTGDQIINGMGSVYAGTIDSSYFEWNENPYVLKFDLEE